tara:strand:- start:2153 stop:2500 length:348 start_codon:yes stop_codon:yes gene_type:complete
MSELANEQIFELKRMGFTNEQIAEDLRYDKDVVDIVVPEDKNKIPAIADRLDALGEAGARVLEELLTYAEHEKTRADIGKFLVHLKYDKEKTKANLDFSQFTERIQRAKNIIADK